MSRGGKSVRYDVAVPPELDALVQSYMRHNRIERVSDVVRTALAELVGQPDLSEKITMGRPKKERP